MITDRLLLFLSYCSRTGQHFRPVPVKLIDVIEVLSRELISNRQTRTATLYRCTVRGLIRFTGNKNLLLTGITPALLRDYENYLTGLNRKPNTISSQMRHLRTIYNKAALKGLVPQPPANLFAGVHTEVHETPKRALTGEEMRTLSQLAGLTAITATETPEKATTPATAPNKSLKNLLLSPRFYYTLLLFLFSFQACGMPFVDMIFLQKSNIRDGHIHYQRKKTGKHLSVKITAQMQWIIDYFAGMTAGSPYLFPILNPHKGDLRKQYQSALATYNRRLRKIGLLAGISKRLTFHVARHSWATIAKRKNVPLGMISECLGHRDEKTTAIYLDSFETSRMDEISELVSGTIC
jgi:integrase